MVRDAVGLGIPSEVVSRIEDLDIPVPGGKLPIRMYVPHSEDSFPESAPVLIYYHGGVSSPAIWRVTMDFCAR
jgi:poly(3-hydroxybutyrate) depolymerase